jgi:hypothetical protein
MALRGGLPNEPGPLPLHGIMKTVSSIVVVCVGSGIIRCGVALSLPVVLLVTGPSSLVRIFLLLRLVLSTSEAALEACAGRPLHDLGNRRKGGGQSYRAGNFRLAPFYKGSVK